MLEEGNRAYALLRQDPKAWSEELEKRELWDNTLSDGLEHPDGHEQAVRRPCLVIPDDIYNAGPAANHIIIPITSRNKRIPYHVELAPPEGCLRMQSYLMCDDLRSISRERFVERFGVVCKPTLRCVNQCLQTSIFQSINETERRF